MPPNPSLIKQMQDIRWFHQIELAPGVVSPGIDKTAQKLQRIQMPPDLSGKTVLDIGAWDGFFSFEAERRNASRVLAVDSYCWSEDGWANKQGFDCAKRCLNSKVEELFSEVLDLPKHLDQQFDLVLFLGVLYHLRHPLRALEVVSGLTKDHLILETKVDRLLSRQPTLTFYPNDESNRDPTNWWAPNLPALEAMLLDVGFRRIQVVSKPKSILNRIFRRPTRPRFWLREIQQSRVTVHAWK